MTYGITGNITKQEIWTPIGTLVAWLLKESIPFVLETAVASGLVKRELLSSEHAAKYGNPNLPQASDVILSFGGDGTLLSTAHNVGAHQTPILGVNFGRLGFLADTEVSNLNDTIRRLEQGAYRIQERMVLEARFEGKEGPEVHWALNDFVLERSLMPQLISVEVSVDGAPLTTYWADGLIISTPTGSTAYALSVGGPILAPGSNVMALTPIAPHTLTVRPLVLPASAIITADVQANNFVFAADGRSTSFEGTSPQFSIKRAQHSVRLIKLPEQDYFQTLRSKLRWSGR
ncbi:MAG: NAD(+)/NADH kinase [Bacteroidota bacterium]